MIEQINYKILSFNDVLIEVPERIRQYILYDKYNIVIIRFGAKIDDLEHQNYVLENIHCYNNIGNLKWIYPKGIVGIAKEDEDTIKLFDGEYLHFVDVVTGIEDKSKMKFLK